MPARVPIRGKYHGPPASPPAPPSITSFSPGNGVVGSSVVITGQNFTSATLVTLNNVSASFVVNTDTQITMTVPNTTTGPIRVTTAGGTATSATDFQVAVPAGFGPTLGAAYVRSHAGFNPNPVAQPGGATVLNPGGTQASYQAAINAAGVGANIIMTPGYYRILSGTLTLLSGQDLIGPAVPANQMTPTNAAIITGAAVATAVLSGGYWQINATAQGFTSLGNDSWAHGTRPLDGVDATLVTRRDGVYIDDFPLWQVNSLAALDQATPYGWDAFYWDVAAGIIYMRANPTGKRLEVCKNGNTGLIANNAVVRNIIIEKFGPAVNTDGAGSAMLDIGQNGLAENIVARCSHSSGVSQSSGLQNSPSSLIRSIITRNGLIGVSGGHSPAWDAGPVLVDTCEFSENNIGGFNWAWEGVMKWNRTGSFVFRNSWVHNQYGHCLWVDGHNYNWLYEENVSEDNYGSGAELELGYAGIVRRNAFYRDGFYHPSPTLFAAGVHPANSCDVQVYLNIIENCVGGATCSQDSRIGSAGTIGHPSSPGPYPANQTTQIKRLDVHHNLIIHPSSWPTAQFGMGLAAGLGLSGTPDVGYYTVSFDNRWHDNTYFLGDKANGQHFRWSGGNITWAQWQALGQDAGSTAAQI